MSRNGTSLREQSLFYYIKKFFPDTVNRYKMRYSNKKLEVDVYVPTLNLVIEYDGGHWHRNKVDTDNRKNKAINDLGYTVLHVREYGLPPLDKFNGDVIDLPYEGINDRGYDYINLTLEYLSGLVMEPQRTKLKSFHVDKLIYESEAKYIYALRYPDIVQPNLTTMCGIEYWDYGLNDPLEPTHVAKLDWVPATLKCENAREIPLPRYHRNYKQDCITQCRMCCYGVLCPLICYCQKDGEEKIHCNYVENKVWDMIENGESINKYEHYYTIKSWLIRESDIGERIIQKYLQCSIHSKERRKIAAFLGCDSDYYIKLIEKDEFDIHSAF